MDGMGCDKGTDIASLSPPVIASPNRLIAAHTPWENHPDHSMTISTRTGPVTISIQNRASQIAKHQSVS